MTGDTRNRVNRLRYQVIIIRAALAHWLMPAGHSRGVFHDARREIDETVTRYGARLGVVEPCFHWAMQAEPLIAEVMEALRGAKQFDLADKLRDARKLMNDAGGYAFPAMYGKAP
jgi:hypothetical protein